MKGGPARRALIPRIIPALMVITSAAGLYAADPPPLLVIEGLGNGYSSPAITSGGIFITGERDGIGYLCSYDLNGKLFWKTPYGEEWTANFPGSRAAPTVSDSMVYTTSGLGDVACFDIKTGKKQWAVNMIRDMHGVNAVFGYSMPVLVDHDRVYCQPGGPDTNIACLNRYTGKIIWTSKGDGETPGYTSPLVIRHHERNLLVIFSELALLGLDAGTGEILWNYDLSLKGDAPCNKPVYSDGCIYFVAGKGNGAAKLEISKDGSSIKTIWSNVEFNSYFGGFVLVDSFLYGNSEHSRSWMSIDAATGRPADSLSFRTGAIVSTGENLVLYNQAGGVGLVRLNRGHMTLVRSFVIAKGSGEHFAHPVFAGGRLYIRHGDVLLVYDYQQLMNL